MLLQVHLFFLSKLKVIDILQEIFDMLLFELPAHPIVGIISE